MKILSQLFIAVAFLPILHQFSLAELTKGEACEGKDRPCSGLIGYNVPNNLKLQVISNLFGVRPEALLGANEFDLTIPDITNVVIPQGTLLKIPLPCSCINGLRQVNSTLYTIMPGDTLSKIAGYFSNLITYQQIASANNISNVNLIYAGSALLIPLPCACHNGTNQGRPAYFLSYQVQAGETLEGIANYYNVSETDLQTLNSLSAPSDVEAWDILDIPIPACTSSFKRHAVDRGLLVPRGSYILTARNCVQCSCTNGSTEVYCSQTPKFDLRSGSCSRTKCANSSLSVGSFSTTLSKNECRVNSCVYQGFTNTTIFTSLQSELDRTCPAAPPPQPLYKPPEDVASSPLTGPEPGGPAQSSPNSLSSESPPAGGSGTPTGGACRTKDKISLTSILGLCLSLFVYAHGW